MWLIEGLTQSCRDHVEQIFRFKDLVRLGSIVETACTDQSLDEVRLLVPRRRLIRMAWSKNVDTMHIRMQIRDGSKPKMLII